MPSRPHSHLDARPTARSGLRVRACFTLPARASRASAIAAALLLFAACAGSVEDRLAEIHGLQDAGQFGESVAPLRELLAENPEQGEANYLLGVALVQTGQLSLAVWPLEKASSDPGQAASAGLLLASTFLALQSHDDAVRVATKLLEQDPARVAALKVRAQALLGANRREEALKDTIRLRELAPDDYSALLMHATILAELGRIEEAEKAHEDLEALAARSGDAGTAVRGCLARATFFKDTLEDNARCEAQFERCIEKGPTDALALRLVTQFYDDLERSDDATALWEKALAEAPENPQIRAALAGRYESNGKADKALALLAEGVELFGTTQAYTQLGEFERRIGHPDKALAAIEAAIQASPKGNDNLSFLEADLLIDLGRLDEAETLVDTLAEPAFRDLLRGRILLVRGDATGALASFDSGLKRWPNNAGGRYLAGLAAYQIGAFARAESEFRDSLRVDPAATDAAYALTNLYLAQGRYKEGVDAALNFVTKRGGGRADGFLLFIRAATALGNFDAARRSAKALEEAGFPQQAAVALAQVELAAAGADAALRQAKQGNVDLGDTASEALLRSIADRLVAGGRMREANDVVSAALAKHPESAALHEIHGVLLVRLDRDGEARASFEKSLELDPRHSRARAGLAGLSARAGDVPRAIALFDEAAKANPDDTGPAYAAARLVLQIGDRSAARQRLAEIAKRDPGHAGARNDLAWLLAQQPDQDLDRALALAEEAHRIDASPEITDTLGWVYLQRGQTERAVELFQLALEKRPESQSTRYHLGVALGRKGERQRAIEMLRQALEAGSFAEAEDAKSEIALLERQ